MNKKNLSCRLCNSSRLKLLYDGKFRTGGIGSSYSDIYSVYRCTICEYAQLEPCPNNLNEYYMSEKYRKQFDNDTSIESIQKNQDKEQNARLDRIGIENLRQKKVLDIGCGPGLFLDAVKGVCSETYAIEPSKIYSDYLCSKHKKYFQFPQDAINDRLKVDIVFSFDTIEHLEDPCSLVDQAFKLLKPGGLFILSMPNHDDLVLKTCFESFSSFFYMRAHVGYFNFKCVRKLFEKSRFTSPKFGYLHKYDLNNLIQWSKHGNPGSTKFNYFDRHFHTLYKAEIERLGIASHHFITATKPN